jgi:hypothetical protein
MPSEPAIKRTVAFIDGQNLFSRRVKLSAIRTPTTIFLL